MSIGVGQTKHRIETCGIKDRILMDGRMVTIKFRPNEIEIGCTIISVNAAKNLLDLWEEYFGKRALEVTHQSVTELV